jgi:hypothetical protein
MFGVPVGLTDGDADRIRDGSASLYIYGRVTYHDTFRPEVIRTTEVTVRVDCSPERLASGERKYNYGFFAIGPQNTAT